jgi:DNA-binding MarR family transcriptional regulator
MAQDPVSDRLTRSAVHLLHRAGQCAEEAFMAQVGESNLTPRQYVILAVVALRQGLSQTDLVAQTGIDRSTLADIVRRMLKKGLIQRRRTKHDARAYAIKLTDEGARILREAEPTAKQVDDRILSVLPARQREQLIDQLELIVRALSGPAPTAL